MRDREYIAKKEDWETVPMPEKTETFMLKMRFEKEEIENLKHGHIPEEMEDRWFSYFEDNKLYIHRSWTGICIFVIEFNKKHNKHLVTVNRDENQYACDDVNEDMELVSELLNCWR